MISSNPYHPLHLQWELLTYGWGNHGWLMERRRWWWWWWYPRNPHPGKCQNGVSGSESWILMVAAHWNSIWEKRRTLDIFRLEGICRRKEGSRRSLGRPHHPLVRPGLACATRWCGALLAPLHLVLQFRVSSGKIGFLQYFSGFFLKVRFLHKNKIPG
jgi:hypothetical protein